MTKRHLIALAASTLPAQVLAHGAHAPTSEAAHGLAHTWPILLIALIALAALVAYAHGGGRTS